MIVPNIVLKFGRTLRQMGANKLKIALGYGMTETGPLCLTPGMTLEELAQHLPAEADPVCVGSPAAGWSIRVVDDAGSALPAGAAGNIEVWSDSKLFSGYRNDSELSQASFTEDGWLRLVMSASPLLAGSQSRADKRPRSLSMRENIALESIEAPVRQLDGIWGSSSLPHRCDFATASLMSSLCFFRASRQGYR